MKTITINHVYIVQNKSQMITAICQYKGIMSWKRNPTDCVLSVSNKLYVVTFLLQPFVTRTKGRVYEGQCFTSHGHHRLSHLDFVAETLNGPN